jgi:virulence-associated protein VapD
MRVSHVRFDPKGDRKPRTTRVYAIAFDIETQLAERIIGPGWKGCYEKIERVLTEHGFRRQQGSLYFGEDDSNAVTCVRAVQDLDNKYAWFGRVVRDLRMLRIDEDNDLLPALSNRLRLDAPAANEA